MVIKLSSQPLIINDTSVIFKQIKDYSWRDLKEDTVGRKFPLITQINLLDSQNLNFGVFRFLLMSSEANYKLYLRNYGEDSIIIIPHYNIDTVMNYLSSFFRDNKKYISTQQRITCTKRVLDVLEARLQ